MFILYKLHKKYIIIVYYKMHIIMSLNTVLVKIQQAKYVLAAVNPITTGTLPTSHYGWNTFFSQSMCHFCGYSLQIIHSFENYHTNICKNHTIKYV